MTRIACLLLLILPALLAGQDGPPASEKRARAVRASSPIRVDGRLDDAAWTRAEFFSDFLLREPVEFGTPGDRTEVAFLYDDAALYVAARLHSADPAAVPRAITRRDQYGNAEHLVVSLDPHFDRRTAFSFSVSAGGARQDFYHARDEFWSRDFTYDPVWDAAVAFDSLGWTAEMRIPFSQLRFTRAEVQRWGLNIQRWVPQRNEQAYWVVVPRNETGFVSRFGVLEGIADITPSRRMELMPYVAATGTFASLEDPADPFADRRRRAFRAGTDFRMGLGPSLTLNTTVNPDFGQVEADPAVLNLTAFETFFDERRPFFTEGQQYLTGPVNNYYYSRRIGGRPRGTASGDYVDMPDHTTILGAAKITGRLASGLSLGVLAAGTGREYARTFTNGVHGRSEVEPATGYGVLRLQQQFGASQSVAGFSLSGMWRDLAPASPLRARLTRRAVAGGGDWLLRFQGGRYEVSGHLGASYVEGDSAAILRLQRSSARYYQRPDARTVRYDPRRTSLAGVTARLGAEKNAGNWLWEVEASTVSPGFETNDMGRLQSAGSYDYQAELTYRWTRPGRVFRRWSISLRGGSEWNYDGDRTETGLELSSDLTWANYLETRLELGHELRAVSDNLTRGGPLMGTPRGTRLQLEVSGNDANPTQWNVEFGWERSELDDQELSVEASLGLRPSPRLSLSFDPEYSREINRRQYLTQLAGGSDATFGTRYVFATVEQTVLAVRFRVNYTLSPDLTLEAYFRPFTASGRFSDFGELPAPRRRDLRLYGTGGTTIVRDGDRYRVTDGSGSFTLPVRDFTEFSFRSNVVLRWEWAPGSTLYLVWQQDREGSCEVGESLDRCPGGTRPGTTARPGFLGDALGAPGDHFLAIKISYWLRIS